MANLLSPHLSRDVFSGFLVSLIALPLCLGIAQASGFPPAAGLMTAIIGGLVAGPFSGSALAIKGPAGGLIAIALGCVEALSQQGDPAAGYRGTLAVIVAAALLQIAFAFLKLGKYSDFFPSSAVHGMMAAIGLIILSKQAYVLLGAPISAKDPIGLLADLPAAISGLNPKIALIGLATLALLLLLPAIRNPLVRKVPAPLIGLLAGIGLAGWFRLAEAGPGYLVNLPADLAQAIIFPDFSRLLEPKSWPFVLMFSLVGSLESLLILQAVDRLDPQRRRSDLDRDLLTVGVGNVLCGFVGALPMISEIVRSSANVASGAKSRWSNVAHGGFLLIYLAFLGGFLHHIPLSALAAMLVLVGYRLAGYPHWRHAWQLGKEQFAVFTCTVAVTLATDLLLGLAAGVALHLIWNLAQGASIRETFYPTLAVQEEGSAIRVTLQGSATFSNWVQLKQRLERLHASKRLIVDLSNLRLADHHMLESLERFAQRRQAHGGQVELRYEDLVPVSAHPLASRKAATLIPS